MLNKYSLLHCLVSVLLPLLLAVAVALLITVGRQVWRPQQVQPRQVHAWGSRGNRPPPQRIQVSRGIIIRVRCMRKLGSDNMLCTAVSSLNPSPLLTPIFIHMFPTHTCVNTPLLHALPHPTSNPYFKNSPWGYGIRACIGSQFALWEAKLFLAVILRCFRCDLDWEGGGVWLHHNAYALPCCDIERCGS